ncbi:MAG: DinB family protein [Gemmatimonadetes bacterium]|nr:DinB family protein [Gemmatimonadota bacterium]
MVEEICELYEFNRWANARVLEATAGLSGEQFTKDLRSSFTSVRDTLVHILGAEWIWLSRWKGVSPGGLPAAWEFPTWEAVRDRWREVETEQTAFVAGLVEESLQQVIAYRNTKGEPFAYPLWQMLRHVVNHSTYHRGQVITMLRQLGAAAVATDLLRFYDEKSRAAAPAGG